MLLLELARQYRGPNTNNGNLVATQSLLKERGWSPAKIARAKAELIASGFIRKTRQGHRHLCDLFAITWWSIDPCPGKGLEVDPESVPSHLWKTKVVVRERYTVVRQRTNQDTQATA